MLSRLGRLTPGWASPPPATMGLLEIRGVGIANVASISAPVALVLVMASDPPRFVERADVAIVAGVEVPSLPFDFRGPLAAIRAEYAMALHGLPHRGAD